MRHRAATAGGPAGQRQDPFLILKARPRFVGQIDGSTEISRRRYDAFAAIVEEETPDIVFTHWPIDQHRDHRAASLLTYDVWLKMEKKFVLYYYEVFSGYQTQLFAPAHYVDITAAEKRKRAATFAHASQNPEGMYAVHERMHVFRGVEGGFQFAEAFVRHPQGPASCLLPA